MRSHPGDTNDFYAILFQQGEESGLNFVYSSFHPALSLFAFYWLQDRPAAEELASEAILKTWRRHAQLDSYAAIRAYLYTIVKRDALRQLRKRTLPIAPLTDTTGPAYTDTPFDVLVRTEVYRQVHHALQALPPGRRQIVSMHVLEGKTTVEIARELQLHSNTVQTQKQKGLVTLRRLLSKALHCFL